MGNDNGKQQSAAGSKVDNSKPLSEEQIELLLSNTKYSKEQIIEFHRKFLEICPKGEFDQKNFVRFFDELRPDKDSVLLCKQMFNAFDTDNSGYVDFNEFLIAISLTSDNEDPKRKLEFAFKMYDANRDDKLSAKEIEKIVRAIYQFTGQEEQNETKKPSEVAKYILAKYDKDKNGFITKEEFINGILVDPTLQALKSFSILRTGEWKY